NTVLAAYRELAAEGWISSEEARGTFVSAEIPDRAPRRFSSDVAKEIASRPGFEIGRAEKAGPDEVSELLERPRPGRPPPSAGRTTLGGGVPDVRLVPAAALARAVRRTARLRTLEVLSYGDPAGPMRLRIALAQMVALTRGVAAAPENVIVSRGS